MISSVRQFAREHPFTPGDFHVGQPFPPGVLRGVEVEPDGSSAVLRVELQEPPMGRIKEEEAGPCGPRHPS